MLRLKHFNYFSIIDEYVKNRELKYGSLLHYNNYISRGYCSSPMLNSLDNIHHPIVTEFPILLEPKRPSKKFEQIMDERAIEIIKNAQGKNIVVLWSGGIDSHIILVALMKNNAKIAALACTGQSILEYKNFYAKFVKNKIPIIYWHDVVFDEEFRNNTVFVTAVQGDTLVGGGINVRYLYCRYDTVRNKTKEIDSLTSFWEFLGHPVDMNYANIFCDSIKSAASKLDVDISTFWQFWNFTDQLYRIHYHYWYSWQQFCYFDMKGDDFSNIEDWNIHFFMTPEFYNWGVHHATLDEKLGSNIFEYKNVYKKYIWDYDKDDNYLNYKLKVSSNFSSTPDFFAKDYIAYDSNYNLIKKDSCEPLLQQLELNNRMLF